MPHAVHTILDSRVLKTMPASHSGHTYSVAVGLVAASWPCVAHAATVDESTCFSTCMRYRCSTLLRLDVCVTSTKLANWPASADGSPAATGTVPSVYSRMNGTASSKNRVSSSCSRRISSESGATVAYLALNSDKRSATRLSSVPVAAAIWGHTHTPTRRRRCDCHCDPTPDTRKCSYRASQRHLSAPIGCVCTTRDFLQHAIFCPVSSE